MGVSTFLLRLMGELDMVTMKCPYCDEGKVTITVVPEYATQLGGVPFTVKNARIGQCDSCERKVFGAKEVKRWENDLREELQSRGTLVRAEQIRTIRQSLGLSVIDFAFLLGVTRQTVHAWEHSNGGVQLGPTALLLGLLAETLAEGETRVVDYLVTAVRERGQSISTVSLQQSIADAEHIPEANREVGRFRDIPGGSPNFIAKRVA